MMPSSGDNEHNDDDDVADSDYGRGHETDTDENFVSNSKAIDLMQYVSLLIVKQFCHYSHW